MSQTHLNKSARKILRALVEVVKPRKPEFDIPVEDFMLDFLDNFYAHFPFHMKIGFPLGLYLLEYGTIVFGAGLRPFSSMSMPDREKYVSGWVNSGMAIRRDLIKGVKGVCLTAFYSHPEVMEHIGYHIDQHLEKVNKGEPCDQEAVKFFREMGYDRNVKVPHPAYDSVEIIAHDTMPEGSSS